MSFEALVTLTGTDGEKRAQVRLAVVEHLVTCLDTLYYLISADAITDPEALAVITNIIADQKADIATYLAGLEDIGSVTPIDQAGAVQGHSETQVAKTILASLQECYPALDASVVVDEDEQEVVALTAAQRTSIETDIDRAVTKLDTTIANA